MSDPSTYNQMLQQMGPEEVNFTLLPFHGEHKRAISSVAFAPGEISSTKSKLGPALACSASADGTAKLWTLTQDHLTSKANENSATKNSYSLPVMGNFIGHSRGINDVVWNTTGSYIATASDDKTARLWDVETHVPLIEFSGHTNFVFSVKFNPQSNLIVTGSFDETVKLWDVRTGECVSTLPAHSDPVTSVDFNRDGTLIASGSYDGLIRVWDTATGECLKTMYAEGNPPVSFLRFSPNGKFLLSNTLDSRLRMWQLAGDMNAQNAMKKHSNKGFGGRNTESGGKCLKCYGNGVSGETHSNTKFCAFSAFYVPQGHGHQCIVSGSEDGKVYVYNLQTRAVKQALSGHADAVLAVAAHDQLPLLASGGMSMDKTVRFWTESIKPFDTVNAS